jgi:hypothetical protein
MSRKRNEKGNEMTTANAVKKLEKAGFTVTNERNIFKAAKAGSRRFVQFIKDGGSDWVTCVKVVCIADAADHTEGVYCDNISRAIKMASF